MKILKVRFHKSSVIIIKNIYIFLIECTLLNNNNNQANWHIFESFYTTCYLIT